MSFLNKIRRLFQEEEKQTKKIDEISLEEIPLLLNKKDKEIEKTMQEETDKLYNEIQILVNKLEEDTDSLSKLDLSKRKAEEGYKNITEVGRKDYLIVLQNLIENLRKKKTGREQIVHITYELNNFVKNSAKSDFKATFLIGKEIETIKQDITKIIKLQESFMNENSQTLEKEKTIKSLTKDYKQIQEYNESKLKINEEINKIKHQKEVDEKRLKEIETKIQLIMKSENYKEQVRLFDEKNTKKAELKSIELKLRALFDSRILEKYLYLETDKDKIKLAKKYLEDPSQAIMSDPELKILKTIEEIKEKIRRKIISLKEPRKTLEKLNIERESLHKFKKEFLKINGEIKEIEDKIAKIKTNIDELIREGASIETNISNDKKHIEAMNKKKEELEKTIENLNKELINSIKEKLG